MTQENTKTPFDNDSKMRCRVCGYMSYEPPWGEDGRTPQFNFCDCCGVEHGYQDSTPVGARKFRAEWIASGTPWENEKKRPNTWVLDKQLCHIPQDFK